MLPCPFLPRLPPLPPRRTLRAAIHNPTLGYGVQSAFSANPHGTVSLRFVQESVTLDCYNRTERGFVNTVLAGISVTGLENQMSQDLDLNVQLEQFLYWLLDPRLFPETVEEDKKRTRSSLERLRRIRSRLEAYAAGTPDYRLAHAIADLKDHEGMLEGQLKSFIRRSPVMTTQSSQKGSPEIAERLLAAVLVCRKLKKGTDPYKEIQKILSNPGSIQRKASQWEQALRKIGRIPPIGPYSKHLRTLQKTVERLEKRIEAGKHRSHRAILESLYGQFLYVHAGRVGWSATEQRMVDDLVPKTNGGGEQWNG